MTELPDDWCDLKVGDEVAILSDDGVTTCHVSSITPAYDTFDAKAFTVTFSGPTYKEAQ